MSFFSFCLKFFIRQDPRQCSINMHHTVLVNICMLIRWCLVYPLKYTFLIFKQHYTYFHTLFHLHVFSYMFSNNKTHVFNHIYQTPPKFFKFWMVNWLKSRGVQTNTPENSAISIAMQDVGQGFQQLLKTLCCGDG